MLCEGKTSWLRKGLDTDDTFDSGIDSVLNCESILESAVLNLGCSGSTRASFPGQAFFDNFDLFDCKG